MENEAGRAVVEGGSLCERKNARGVDTNRNWDIHWGFREKDYDPSEEFPGSKPFRLAFLCHGSAIHVCRPWSFHSAVCSAGHWTPSLGLLLQQRLS